MLVSDDLSMKALGGTFGERTKAALAAGCDVALHCNGDMTEMQEIAAAAPAADDRGARAARGRGQAAQLQPQGFRYRKARGPFRGAVRREPPGQLERWTTRIWQVTTWVIPVLTAITLHEAAHGYVAERFGDDTARRLGRVTFNPLRHVDPFGTIILPALLLLTKAGFLFGYAKPVPVNFNRLLQAAPRHGLRGRGGPGHQSALWRCLPRSCITDSACFRREFGAWLFANIGNAITLNVMLAVFNMLPIPPLDGGRVAVGLLPDALAYPLARLERTGIFVVLGALILLPMARQGDRHGPRPGWRPAARPVNTLVPLILTMAGWD